jgi:hypothetical protein
VVASDTATALAAILAVLWIHGSKTASASTDSVASILTSAFTATGTLTTAYLGIKAGEHGEERHSGVRPEEEGLTKYRVRRRPSRCSIAALYPPRA